MSGLRGSGETYPALLAARVRGHKYFWLVVWVEAESVRELPGNTELSLEGNGRDWSQQGSTRNEMVPGSILHSH